MVRLHSVLHLDVRFVLQFHRFLGCDQHAGLRRLDHPGAAAVGAAGGADRPSARHRAPALRQTHTITRVNTLCEPAWARAALRVTPPPPPRGRGAEQVRSDGRKNVADVIRCSGDLPARTTHTFPQNSLSPGGNWSRRFSFVPRCAHSGRLPARCHFWQGKPTNVFGINRSLNEF